MRKPRDTSPPQGGRELLYLSVLPSALIAVDRDLTVRFINPAAEILIGISAQQIIDRSLMDLPGFDGELCALCERVLSTGESISLFEHTLRLPMKHRDVTLHITPVMAENALASQILITIEKSDGLERVASQELKQEASRAAGVMAAMLAHEVKNPLAGIRGAAQLLKDEVSAEHQALAELICTETDRIRDLLAQVEIFDASALEYNQSVNIHEVLQYVLTIAKSGFARNVEFKERYDPSLPPVIGNRDLLVQLLLNLVKNSAEALSDVENPTIIFTTAYRSGYHIRSRNNSPPLEGGVRGGAATGEISLIGPPPQPSPSRGEGEKVALPIMVTIEDNGTGIAEDMRARLFEPFVSSKEDGRGLGLAIVAKIASDLGAVVELDPECERGTRFALWLPVDNGRLTAAG